MGSGRAIRSVDQSFGVRPPAKGFGKLNHNGGSILRGSRYRIAQKVTPFAPPRWASIDVEQIRRPTDGILEPECFCLKPLKSEQLLLFLAPLKSDRVGLLQSVQIAELKLLQELAACELFVPLPTLPDADCL